MNKNGPLFSWPIPIDAESLVGTLIRLAGSGWQVHIATTNAGDCGTMTETPFDISSIRTRKQGRPPRSLVRPITALASWMGSSSTTSLRSVRRTNLFRQSCAGTSHHPRAKDYMMDTSSEHLGTAASFRLRRAQHLAFPLLPGSGASSLLLRSIDGIDPMGNPIKPTTLVDITKQMPKKTTDAGLACQPARVGCGRTMAWRVHRGDEAPRRRHGQDERHRITPRIRAALGMLIRTNDLLASFRRQVNDHATITQGKEQPHHARAISKVAPAGGYTTLDPELLRDVTKIDEEEAQGLSRPGFSRFISTTRWRTSIWPRRWSTSSLAAIDAGQTPRASAGLSVRQSSCRWWRGSSTRSGWTSRSTTPTSGEWTSGSRTANRPDRSPAYRLPRLIWRCASTASTRSC